MRPASLAFAAAFLLGGVAASYAQEGPVQKEDRPAQAQKQKEDGKKGGSADSDSSAKRSSEEGRRTAKSEDAQQERGDTPKGNKSAEREGSNQDKQKRAQGTSEDAGKRAESKDERPQESKRSQTKEDEGSKDTKRAEKGDRAKDTKREEATEDSSRGAKRAEKEDGSRDGKREAKESQREDTKRAETRDERSRDQSEKRAEREDRAKGDQKRAEPGKGEARQAELKGERQERVRSALREHATEVRELRNVGIDISIGRSLPRDWEYYTLPEAVIAIVPEYRDYRYVFVDGEYVIVDPDSYEVVTVISTSGGRTFAGGGGATRSGRSGTTGSGCPSDLSLSDDDKDYLLRSVQMRNVDVGDVAIGMDVPKSVELQAFPDSVIKRVAGLQSCRYFVADDKIAIVDPGQHEVVILVE